MRVVRFTKFWPQLSVAEMGERAAALGYDGLDLAVRPGQAITPANVAETLPNAVRQWASVGVDCALISATTDLIDPTDEATRRLFAAAAKSGVRRIKIGYFQYQPGTDFAAAFEQARRALSGFEALSRQNGVQTLYHTHSGLCLGSNCAGLRHLLEDFDPELIGAYPDLGHLAINGEDVSMGLAMLRGSIAAIAAKDARHARDPRPNPPAAYGDAFVPLGEGAAEWRAAMRLLRAWDFAGPFSVHTEYTEDPEVLASVGAADTGRQAEAMRERGEKEDLEFLRALWDEAESPG